MTLPVLVPVDGAGQPWDPATGSEALEGAAPAVVSALGDFYGRLPEHYRESDEALEHPLYRWLAGPVGELGTVVGLLDAIDRRGPDEGGDPGDTSTLADPTVAPAEWLPWLAQLVGVALYAGLSPMEARDAVTYASAGWRAGNKTSVADAVRTALTGTRYARVYDHSVTNPGDGGEWDVLVVTRSTETASSAAVLAAVVRRGAKPTGVMLHHRAYESSWDAIGAKYPTWNALEAAGSWDTIEEAGLT